MPSSEFWHNLAQQFLLVPSCETLRADGQHTIGSDDAWKWEINGAANDFAQSTFGTLARRGAFEIADTGSSDLLITWFEALRKEQCNFTFQAELMMQAGPSYLMGRISRLCEASVNLCRKLEARELQAEFEEKQRSNPKNWSPLRQRFEAFKAIKELQVTPPERIPEALVRDVVAEQLGIKPEEVTWKQIQFEVSGLLPSYPHIELIPSASKIESPPVPDTKPSDQQEPKPAFAALPKETIASQLQRLREECRWTIPVLAEAANLSPRQVARHLSGEFQPLPRNISAYERAFTKQLKRNVVINKMS